MQEIKLYNKTETITFNDNGHIFLNKKGERLLSVTSITGIIDKSQPLICWAVKLTLNFLKNKWLNDKFVKITEEDFVEASKQHRFKKQEAADIGTEIHSWVSEWIKGNKPAMPDNEKIINGITAFLKFQKEYKIKWLLSEKIVYSKKYNYTGILDAIGREGKELILVDFKSSNGIYDEMLFQVAGYQIAYEEETKKKISKLIIIRFGKNDGNFEVKEIIDVEKNKKAFLACLEIKKRLDELKKSYPLLKI